MHLIRFGAWSEFKSLLQKFIEILVKNIWLITSFSRYLKGFKWSHLTEQLSFEKRVEEQRMRVEIVQAKKQARHFIDQVEKGEKIKKLEEKASILKQIVNNWFFVSEVFNKIWICSFFCYVNLIMKDDCVKEKKVIVIRIKMIVIKEKKWLWSEIFKNNSLKLIWDALTCVQKARQAECLLLY